MPVSFDKKLAELDAYLQMLIVENESLGKKLNALSSSSLSLQNLDPHDNEKEGLTNIKNNLEKLLSSIKHAIVLLQIAKVSSKATSSGEHFRPEPIPSPPARPIRSSKLTHSSSSKDSGSHSRSSQEYSAGSAGNINNNNNNNKKRDKSNSITCSSSSETSNSCYASSQRTQQLKVAASAASAANLEQQRDNLSQHQPHFKPPPSSSSSSLARGARAETASSEIKIGNGSKNEATNLNRDEEHENNYVGSSNVDEEDEDAFFDAADEQQLSSNNKSTPTDNDNNAKGTDISEYSIPNPQLADDKNRQDSRILSTAINESLHLTSSNKTQTLTMPPNQQSSSNIINETNNNNHNDDNNSIEEGSIDWDALYEEDEDELGSMEGQGSVIKHLLSQIRIGMDLTKVVLPTFILERRSLLEMYADFFAHPDLFSTIPDFETPEERMIQLVRWYLSAFHAGRRSSVAKKPYNPILGEIFRCEWNLNSEQTKRVAHNNNNNNNTDNNISHNDQQQQQLQQQKLTFVAEQVSHHPPVSAFYAENKEKHISCCAHIYTKSKYLGLSVGVHNIGQGVITLSKHNETYVCTFPSAYGRSILTMPWVELGGSVNISCEQTGYKANIEFVMKPFYGGKKHRVTGEILRPNNEPILTIDGEWNGIMYSKAPPNSSEKKIFVDTTNLPVIKKHVDSINGQETFESRNVWKEVTRALKIRDVNGATAAKSFIEQRQRDLLKDRLEKGIKWKTRFFETCDDGWKYSPN